jgi:hypothetical protein
VSACGGISTDGIYAFPGKEGQGSALDPLGP